MKVETKTSFYELTKDGDGFRLVKLSIKPGAVSSALPGDGYSSSRIWLTPLNGLELDTMHTSPIVNLVEVRQWMKENGA